MRNFDFPFASLVWKPTYTFLQLGTAKLKMQTVTIFSNLNYHRVDPFMVKTLQIFEF